MVTVLGFGAAGGYWYSSFGSGRPSSGSAQAPESASADVFYTCGMHPQVVQRDPGVCPICNMKLTPMKQDGAEEESAPSGPQEKRVLYWRSPMHPDYVSDLPGKDFMGHDLVPVYSHESERRGGPIIRIDPVVVQNMGIRTSRVRRGPLVKSIRTLGRIDYDEQKLVFVDTKIAGWIEKLYVDETGQAVKSGDPLFEIYSPELYSAQVEYVSALRKLPTMERSTFPDAVEDARRMVEAARQKLDYFDVPSDQIDRLAKTLTLEKAMQIQSPADGIVADKMALEGMRIMPGMRLFTIADLSRVWVYVDIYEYQLPWVHVGQIATMTLPYIPAKVFRGEVTYIYPYVQKQTRVIKMRLEFENPTLELKPDMYANVVLEGLLKQDAVLVPREGFIDSGTRKVAFVDRGQGKYEPRDLQVGVEAEGGEVEVLLGLNPGEVVVTSGQFLLDSESKLKEALAKMMEPTRLRPGSNDAGISESRPSDVARTTSMPAEPAYACPMDKHPDEADPARQGAYFSDEAGDCPWCGMKLKPITELKWAMAMKAADGAEVAYSCSDHPQVLADSPGACPVCDQELSPFKATFTCPNPKHSRQVSATHGRCPECGEPFAMFRGPWLGEDFAATEEPVVPPEVSASEAAAEAGRTVPTDARYVCPMQECWAFSQDEGRCPVCGMKLQPIDRVEWAANLVRSKGVPPRFVCPMHPNEAKSDEPGICSICAMQLVPPERIVGLDAGSASVAAQVDFLTEHYLGLQTQLAGDRKSEVARHALGLVDASEKLRDILRDDKETDAALLAAVSSLHSTSLRIRGKSLDDDRSHFAQISAAMRTIIKSHRPDKTRWPKLFIYHCPMSNRDWLQSVEKKANPFYGFKMLDCGNLVETK
jgi:Cu(I)/Ag(I) efflux system membrane fusion protein/cobalt-zinc-cadmium efflux system membrane fusion protein